MTEAATTTNAAAPVRNASLATRLIGVLLSPRDAYTLVAARPRALGAMVVAIAIMVGASAGFLSTQVGRDALMARQLEALKTFSNGQVSDQQVQQLERQAP
jgi:hypothetical protein